jgi:hypothetical protein
MGAGTSSKIELELADVQVEILDDLERVAHDLGKPPTTEEYREHGEFSPEKVRYWFSTWNDALYVAGVGENHEYVDEEDALDALREWIESVEGTPTKDKLNEGGPYSISVYREIAGSWNDALRMVGVRPQRERNIPKAKLEGEFQRVAKKLDKRPSRADMNKYGEYSPDPYGRVWDSWGEAKRSIEVPELDE